MRDLCKLILASKFSFSHLHATEVRGGPHPKPSTTRPEERPYTVLTSKRITNMRQRFAFASSVFFLFAVTAENSEASISGSHLCCLASSESLNDESVIHAKLLHGLRLFFRFCISPLYDEEEFFPQASDVLREVLPE